MADTLTDTGTDFDVVSALMDYEEGESNGVATLDLFSYLISSGMINGMQGRYGREAIALVSNGWLTIDGTILRYPEDPDDE